MSGNLLVADDLPRSSVEGRFMTWDLPVIGECKTWYTVFGDLKASAHPPLVAVHGGPGVNCDCFLPMLKSLYEKYSIPSVTYDQIGNGDSTYIPNKDPAFWTVDLFLTELDKLLEHLGIQENYVLYGHSWGGMLSASHAVRTPSPKGLQRLILAGSPASINLWIESQWKLRAQLPQNVQDALAKHEAEGTTDSPDYMALIGAEYLPKHLYRGKPFPHPSMMSALAGVSRSAALATMLGGTTFEVKGTLKDWSIIEEAEKIGVPTLLANGKFDQAQDLTMEPYFERVRSVKWVTFPNSSHMPQLEEPEKFLEVLNEFLTSPMLGEMRKGRLFSSDGAAN